MSKDTSALFSVYLRLRPHHGGSHDRFLDVEPASPTLANSAHDRNEGSENDDGETYPTHITIRPPSNDGRKRAIERFAFTRVFEEQARQMDIFSGTGIQDLVSGVLGMEGPGLKTRDALVATLGMTGSGKSHTILGSKSQRGLIQLSLDAIFQATEGHRVGHEALERVFPSIVASDVAESVMATAGGFLEGMYPDYGMERGSRYGTPAPDASIVHRLRHPAAPNVAHLPQEPQLTDFPLTTDGSMEYCIVISMYEVYNDRIFDLLASPVSSSKTNTQATARRRALLFKSTEFSPDRKVVAGLRKIVCTSLHEALMVLETGLTERKVAGTGSNAVSSRSHGFFCIEVKKRSRARSEAWASSAFTVVDLAGSERARNAKTAGATLAEAGKINESLMYLGQCMQLQSDNLDGNKQNIVPYRQCKLTELLFSNSFPSSVATSTTSATSGHYTRSAHHTMTQSPAARNPQKAIMIVTADPLGDFNATSQILRYSALAREVTVPRIASTSSQILNGQILRSRPASPNVDLHNASEEILRLQEAVEVLSYQLDEERARRHAAEVSWAAADARAEEVECEVRDECFAAMEAAVQAERQRWRDASLAEGGRQEAFMDGKLEILSRNFQEIEIHEDGNEVVPAEGVRELEAENEVLRRQVEELRREVLGRSPTKKRVLKSKRWDVFEEVENL